MTRKNWTRGKNALCVYTPNKTKCKNANHKTNSKPHSTKEAQKIWAPKKFGEYIFIARFWIDRLTTSEKKEKSNEHAESGIR